MKGRTTMHIKREYIKHNKELESRDYCKGLKINTLILRIFRNCNKEFEHLNTSENLVEFYQEGNRSFNYRITIGSLKNLSWNGLLEVSGPVSSSKRAIFKGIRGHNTSKRKGAKKQREHRAVGTTHVCVLLCRPGTFGIVTGVEKNQTS